MRLPRYLYHFTSKSNMADILKNGLHGNYNYWDNQVHGANVYMVDMQNFAKAWSKFDNYGYNLQSCLLFGQALKEGERDICCFRIPTKKLTSTIKIRNQKFVKDRDSIPSGTEIVSKIEKYKLYQRNGQSIEYIHSGDIPPEAIEYVGSAEIPKPIENILECEAPEVNNTALEVLRKLFSKTKESKAFD